MSVSDEATNTKHFGRVTSAAYVYAQAAHEAYPVCPRVIPRPPRDHLRSLYGFMRLIDDVADELTGGRNSSIDEVEKDRWPINGYQRERSTPPLRQRPPQDTHWLGVHHGSAQEH